MAEVWGKLNLKDHTAVLVVNAPPSLEPQLKALDGVTVKRRHADVSFDYSLAIVTPQKEDDDLAHIPVVAVTAFAMKGDEERIREGGCEAYISKPISVTHFLETIRRLLN